MSLTDRVLRSLVAVLCLVLFFSGYVSATLGVLLLAVSVVFLLTGLVSFCPLYTLLGISTCKVRK